eukprot:354420_1
MGACSSLPSFTVPSQHKLLSNDSFECAVYATQGHRPRMEDAHVLNLSFPKHPSYALFGVFDGFNGDDASSFFADNIVDTLGALNDLDDNDAIIKAIDEMDTKYIHSPYTEPHNPNAGCTFVFALISKENASVSKLTHSLLYAPATSFSNSIPTQSSSSRYDPFKVHLCDDVSSTDDTDNRYRVRVFWAGDSRAALMSDNYQCERLTKDHHCTVQSEKQRILNANGTIINDRIDGVVEVTRCFGCHVMKSNESLPNHEQKMISVPECNTFMAKSNDRLFIFCDGLVKTWSDSQFNSRAKHHVMQHSDGNKGAVDTLKYLCEQAVDEGSKDNITVLSVKFK